jgi:FAD/FMN-containing dehydrogenase
MAVCHCGDPARAARDVGPLKASGPIADLVWPRRYVDQQSIFDPMQPKGLHTYWKTEFLPRLSDDALAVIRGQATEIPAPLSIAVLMHLGAAVAETAPDATAFGTRNAEHVFFAAGTWEPSDPDADRHLAWVRAATEALRPYSIGNYVNGQMDDDGETRLREAYGDNLERLAKIKAAYDPENLFRSNRNIAPVP